MIKIFKYGEVSNDEIEQNKQRRPEINADKAFKCSHLRLLLSFGFLKRNQLTANRIRKEISRA